MYIADLHIHSKYSRATSKELEPEPLDAWARRKGIGLVGTGDFTPPAWRAELRDKLAEAEEGLYTLKGAGPDAPRFVITGEISSIYKKNGKVRKVHSLILLPHLEAAETPLPPPGGHWQPPLRRKAHPGPGLPGSAGDHPGVLP